MYYFVKRAIDLVIVFTSLVVLSPLLIIVSLILKFTGEGEVFYLQDRLGYLNSEFKIIKFATMLKNSPNLGTGSITLRDDPRVLPIGRFLRKSKINELPQIINVIKGEMTMVGPRPQMKADFEKFPTELRDDIFKSKPGITGIGSIFFRDEEKWISNFSGDKHQFYMEKIAPYKTKLELWYLKNKSTLVDLKIIFLTFWIIILPNSKMLEKVFRDLPNPPEFD